MAGAAVYFVLKRIPADKDANNTVTVIDYDNPCDSVITAQSEGKILFFSKCASCHLIFRDATGPALAGVTERIPWLDSKKLYRYIRQPELFGKSRYIDSLRQIYGSNHSGFPDLTDEEISAIFKYINLQNKGWIVDVID